MWSKKRQGERSTNHKKMVNWFIMREIVGLESFQLLKICRKVQGKRREREKDDNFSKPMRINRITDEKALKPAFMWERMSESWKL